MLILLGILFVANALAHVVSFQQLRAENDDAAPGVAGFVIINAVLAILMFADVEWGIWPALIFPSLGLTGLTATRFRPGKGTPIDFVIGGLDAVTIVLVIIEILGR